MNIRRTVREVGGVALINVTQGCLTAHIYLASLMHYRVQRSVC